MGGAVRGAKGHRGLGLQVRPAQLKDSGINFLHVLIKCESFRKSHFGWPLNEGRETESKWPIKVRSSVIHCIHEGVNVEGIV